MRIYVIIGESLSLMCAGVFLSEKGGRTSIDLEKIGEVRKKYFFKKLFSLIIEVLQPFSSYIYNGNVRFFFLKVLSFPTEKCFHLVAAA